MTDKTKIRLILTAVAILWMLFIGIQIARALTLRIFNHEAEITPEMVELVIVPEPEVNVALEEWKHNMRMCESGDNPMAVNEVDMNGKSSNGLWQFQRGTWLSWIDNYKPFPTEGWEEADYENALWSRWHQERVIEEALKDPEMNWQWHFPTCANIYGNPPTGNVRSQQSDK